MAAAACGSSFTMVLFFGVLAGAAAAEDAAQETAARTERMTADENRVGAEVRKSFAACSWKARRLRARCAWLS